MPIWMGRVMPAALRSSAHLMIGPASKANCVARAISASEVSEKACFQRSASLTLVIEPSGSMSLLPSGWPATCRRLKPALPNSPRFPEAAWNCENRHAVFHAAGQQQRLLDTRLALVAGDPVCERRLILDDPRREMRHDRIALIGQTPRGGDHVVNRACPRYGRCRRACPWAAGRGNPRPSRRCAASPRSSNP